MPKFRLVAGVRWREQFVRLIAARVLTLLAVIIWPSSWLIVAVLHARQFGTGLEFFSREPLSTFAWHQALTAAGPWGSIFCAAIADELRSSR